MTNQESLNFNELLINAGVTPTPVRILVYRFLNQSKSPASLADIESALESVDKSTVSRTLNTFRKHHLVHAFNDGSGSLKYEICNSKKNEDSSGRHVHFHCENCGKTLCLTQLQVPSVDLPSGYIVREATYLITGICDDCSKKVSGYE